MSRTLLVLVLVMSHHKNYAGISLQVNSSDRSDSTVWKGGEAPLMLLQHKRPCMLHPSFHLRGFASLPYSAIAQIGVYNAS